MPGVYVTGSNAYRRRFHARPDCPQLTKGPASGSPQDVVQIDLDERDRATPCLECYPEAPRPRSAHRYCYTCDPGRVKPCEHNGGVRVWMTRVRSYQTLFTEPGDEYYQERWVWPEKAHLYLSRT